MRVFYLLLTKDGKLYYDTTFDLNSLNKIESEVTSNEVKKLSEKLKIIDKRKNGFDSIIKTFNDWKRKTKNGHIDHIGLNKLIKDLDIIVDSVNITTRNITFLNLRTNEKFEIDQLGENGYRNLFEMHDEIVHEIIEYNFDNHFTWKKIVLYRDKNKTSIKDFISSLISISG